MSWQIEFFGPVPENLVNAGRCVGLDIDGSPGIFIRQGYWLNLDSMVWEVKSPAPYNPRFGAGYPENMLFSFRGLPTMIGAKNCDNTTACDMDLVIQYDPDWDMWMPIGELLNGRFAHEVIEVPGYFCDSFTTLTTPSNPATPTGSTSTPMPPMEPDSAAIIFGGVYQGDGVALNSFEVFGCPEMDGPTTFSLGSMPFRGHSRAGVYDDTTGDILICGGSICTDDVSCDLSTDCHRWNPATNSFTSDASLQTIRSHFLMTILENEPTAIGGASGTDLTEQYDSGTNTWSDYRRLPASDYNTWQNCLIHYKGFIYSITNTVVKIDPNAGDWVATAETLAPSIPGSMIPVGKCVGFQINGDDGIFTSFGYWFNLRTNYWETVAAPPLRQSEMSEINALELFNGRPTIFGFHECDVRAECEEKAVIQYDPEWDMWYTLGSMTRPRFMHTVVEVPLSVCDDLARPAPRPDAALVIGGFYQRYVK